jgi:hypothetical protein
LPNASTPGTIANQHHGVIWRSRYTKKKRSSTRCQSGHEGPVAVLGAASIAASPVDVGTVMVDG